MDQLDITYNSKNKWDIIYNNESNSKFLEITKYGFSECLKQDVPKNPSFKFV